MKLYLPAIVLIIWACTQALIGQVPTVLWVLLLSGAVVVQAGALMERYRR